MHSQTCFFDVSTRGKGLYEITSQVSFFERLVPEDADGYTHTFEGPDDMTSHIRMALTRTSEVVPVSNGKMVLGTWQGIFLFEHRRAPQFRQIAVNIAGC